MLKQPLPVGRGKGTPKAEPDTPLLLCDRGTQGASPLGRAPPRLALVPVWGLQEGKQLAAPQGPPLQLPSPRTPGRGLPGEGSRPSRCREEVRGQAPGMFALTVKSHMPN